LKALQEGKTERFVELVDPVTFKVKALFKAKVSPPAIYLSRAI
jgi:predicted ATPase